MRPADSAETRRSGANSKGRERAMELPPFAAWRYPFWACFRAVSDLSPAAHGSDTRPATEAAKDTLRTAELRLSRIRLTSIFRQDGSHDNRAPHSPRANNLPEFSTVSPLNAVRYVGNAPVLADYLGTNLDPLDNAALNRRWTVAMEPPSRSRRPRARPPLDPLCKKKGPLYILISLVHSPFSLGRLFFLTHLDHLTTFHSL